jgi:hypothetical protein
VKNLVRALSIVALALSLANVPVTAQDQRVRRGDVNGDHFLELDGEKVGFLHSAEGGHARAEVIEEALGTQRAPAKHVGNVKYSEFNTQIGFAMDPKVYHWLSSSFSPIHARKNGAIHALDFQMNAKTEIEFFNALITEVGFPACDGAAKDPAYMTLKFAPEYTRKKPASGNVSSFATRAYQQRRWIPSNFRLTINGVDCTKVSKIEALTLKQKVSENPVGEPRDYLKEPGKIDYPNIKVTLSEEFAHDFFAWFEDFVIQGNNDAGKEKTGSLEFLSPNLQTVLLKLNFFNLGIFKCEPAVESPKSCDCDLCETVVAGANSARGSRKIKAEMYCERMEIVYQPPPTGD